MIFRQIVFYSLIVGFLSGLTLTVAQTWQVVPIIHSAEVFEKASAARQTPMFRENTIDHQHLTEEWAPNNGIERTAFTLLANVLSAIGFALLIMVAIVTSLRLERNNTRMLNWRHGLIWGAAGYAIFWLAPALGLPPEIPLAATADLEARQLWWLFSVVFTAVGLAGLAFNKSPLRWAFPLLLVIPHLIGAPHIDTAMFVDQPPSVATELELLAQMFVRATALVNAILWIVLGVTSVWAVQRIISSHASQDAGFSSKVHLP